MITGVWGLDEQAKSLAQHGAGPGIYKKRGYDKGHRLFLFAQLAMTYYNSKWVLFGFQILLIGAMQYEKKLYNKRCQKDSGTTDK